VGDWSQTEELLYCLNYVKSLQQARELGEEEASERLGRMGQSGASILPRKTAGPVPCFYKGNRPYGLFDSFSTSKTKAEKCTRIRPVEDPSACWRLASGISGQASRNSIMVVTVGLKPWYSVNPTKRTATLKAALIT
jgi:hypothetical protein